MVAIDVAIHHGVPGVAQVARQLLAHARVVQWQRAGRDQQCAVVALPEHADNHGHEPQHAASALEALQCGPVLVEPLEDLRVDGIAGADLLLVRGLAALGREVGAVRPIQAAERLDGAVARFRIGQLAEQAAAHDLE